MRRLFFPGLLILTGALLLAWAAAAHQAAAAPPPSPPPPGAPNSSTTTALNEGFEDTSGTTLARSEFASVVPTCVPGGCGWTSEGSVTHSGLRAAFAPDVLNVADQQLTLGSALQIPSDATSAGLTFWQRYTFETPNFDGGVLEASTDGGSTWVDQAGQLTGGGYNGTISTCCSNPLTGRAAWVGSTNNTWVQVTANLLAYAGQSLLFRFRLDTDGSNGATGWYIDDVQATFSAPLPCAASTWAAAAAYPMAVGGNAVVGQGSAVYSFGGDANGQVTDGAYRYDQGTNTWTAISPLPAPRVGAGATSDGTYLYILGGDDAGGNPTETLYRYNPAANSYTTLAPSLESSVYGAVVALNGKIYRIGGDAIGYDNVYTIASNTWDVATSYPLSHISGLSAVALNGYLYAGGGNVSSGSTNKTYRYDPATTQWSDGAVADLPTARGSISGGVLNGRWIIAGGLEPSVLTKTALAWNPATNTWTSVAQLLQLQLGAVGVAGQTLYTVAGANLFLATSAVQAYTEPACAATPTPPPGATNTPPPAASSTPPPAASSTPRPPSSTPPPGASSTPPPGATSTPRPPTSTPPPGATATPCALGFNDVHPADYFYTPVLYLACHGVLSGYADGTFRPYANTTRGQLAKIVVNGFGAAAYTPPAGGYTFADVQPAHPFFAVVEAAAHAGIVSGYGCGGPGEPCDGAQRPYVRPYANVTRGQLAKIVTVAAGWPLHTPATGTFADVLPGSPFFAFVETAVCHGVVSGYACGGPGEPCNGTQQPYFRQYHNSTRGQIAKIVYGALTGGGACGPAP